MYVLTKSNFHVFQKIFVSLRFEAPPAPEDEDSEFWEDEEEEALEEDAVR